MYPSRSEQAKTSAGFVEQVATYVERCLQGLAAKEERQGAGPDPRGPGRPIELPKVALWSGLLLALDETTLDPVARKLPILQPVKKGAVELLPGKLAGLYDVRLQLWRRIDYLPETLQNGKVHAMAMLKGLAPGSLLLFDLGYFSFEWLDHLSEHHYGLVCRLREKTSYTVLQTFYTCEEAFDGLVWLGNYHAQAGHAVRLVRFRVGALTLTYLTNVLDPTVLSIQEIARLYARRWDIELAFLTRHPSTEACICG